MVIIGILIGTGAPIGQSALALMGQRDATATKYAKWC